MSWGSAVLARASASMAAGSRAALCCRNGQAVFAAFLPANRFPRSKLKRSASTTVERTTNATLHVVRGTRCAYVRQAQLKKLELDIRVFSHFLRVRRATATADRPPRGIGRKFGLRLRMNKTGFAHIDQSSLRLRRKGHMSAILRAARYRTASHNHRCKGWGPPRRHC